MIYEKRYIQFNDLVFDGYDMISDYDEPVQYKGTSQEYSYTHGSYNPLKSDYLFINERQVNMTITLKLKKVPCEQRIYYARFALQELSRAGKLWAVKGDELVWAFARINNMRPVNSGRKDEIVYDVEFVVPSGVWYKADKQKTFLIPYSPCAFMECKGFEEYDPCANANTSGDCCSVCEEKKAIALRREMCGCCCDDITADMSLCYHKDLQAFYSCDTPYQVVYDCMLAERFNDERAFGQRICTKDICDDSVIAGRIYVDTDLPTNEITITLVGDAVNPEIEINGNANIIEGEYSGELKILPSGDIYYKGDCCCGDGELLANKWIVPANMTYGWTLYPQLNSVIVRLNQCCSQERACIYIDYNGLTI